MNKEILRITNLKNINSKKIVNNISFAIYNGEILAFVGFTNSGKFFISEFLKGNKNAPVEYIAYRGKVVNSINDLKAKIFSLNSLNANITNLNMGNWTIAEFLMLEKYKSFLGIININKINNASKELLEKFNLKIDVKQKFNDCSIFEKLLLELIKIYNSEANIIIIENDMPDLNVEEIEKLKLKIKEIFIDKAIIIINYSDDISFRIADRFILMENGKIIKKWDSKKVISNEDLKNHFDMMHSVLNKDEKILLNSSQKIKRINKDQCLFFYLDGDIVKLPLIKSSLIIFLVKNSRKKLPIFEYLSNINIYKSKFPSINKIGIIKHLGNNEDLLTKMTIGENLLIPSYETFNNKTFIINQKYMTKVAENELFNKKQQTLSIKDLSTNQRIRISLERWYLRNPDILIILEPFEKCDNSGIEIVSSYINKFKQKGTIIILIKSRLEHLIDTNKIVIKV